MFKLMGKNSDVILSRLKSWRLTDGNGTEGDNLTLTINADDIDGIPSKGEKYTVYLGQVKRDVFEISQRSIELLPREIKLVLTVSPFSINDVTGYRERKSFSWDNTTLSQVVSDCVTPHGFAFFVHPGLQKTVIQHVDRTEESTPAFLNRLAKQYDAVAKPVEDKYIFVPIGKQTSATGADIESITLSLPRGNTTENTHFIRLSADLDGRSEFNGVRAFYVSTEDGTRQEVKTGSKPFKLLGKDKNSKVEAEQACATELRKIQRTGRKVSINAPVNTAAFAEGIVILDVSFPLAFQGKCSIDSVTISGAGLQPTRMSISATLTGE